jgi:hypothetical protein
MRRIGGASRPAASGNSMMKDGQHLIAARDKK